MPTDPDDDLSIVQKALYIIMSDPDATQAEREFCQRLSYAMLQARRERAAQRHPSAHLSLVGAIDA